MFRATDGFVGAGVRVVVVDASCCEVNVADDTDDVAAADVRVVVFAAIDGAVDDSD